jgi:hypothetical protein
MVLRRIFRTQEEEVIGGYTENCTLRSFIIIRVIKSRRIREMGWDA